MGKPMLYGGCRHHVYEQHVQWADDAIRRITNPGWWESAAVGGRWRWCLQESRSLGLWDSMELPVPWDFEKSSSSQHSAMGARKLQRNQRAADSLPWWPWGRNCVETECPSDDRQNVYQHVWKMESGPVHHAWFMMKAIHIIKIFMTLDQFPRNIST